MATVEIRYARGVDLRPPLAKCEECSLRRCPVVPGYGPDTADLVIVGEAPGDEEVRIGRPFVGPAGRLLSKALSEAGVDMARAYVTNAVLCRPIPHRAPEGSEVAACNERLLAEIRSRRPRVILALGNHALRAICKTRQGITSARGVFLRWEGAAVVMPSWHPAYILRNPAAYPDLLADLRKVAEHLSGSERKAAPGVRWTVVDPGSIPELPDEPVVLDVETASDDSLLCVGLMPLGGDVVYIIPREHLQSGEDRAKLSEILRGRPIIGHNIKFDYRALRRAGIEAELGEDTLLMSYVVDERLGGHDLKRLCQQRLGTEDWEEPVRQARRDNRLESVPREVLYEYNAHDVAYNAGLYVDLLADPEMGPDGRRVMEELLVPASRVIARMEETGVAFDAEAAAALGRKLDEEIRAHTAVLNEVAGRAVNPNSWQQVSRVLYTDLNLPMIPGGSPTDAATLEKLLEFSRNESDERAIRFLETMQNYRKAQKMLSTYVTGLLESLGEDGRIHAKFNLSTTATGRLSSSEPNLQNQPKHAERAKEVRNLFVATPGYTLVEADLSQAELRVLACLSRDPNLLDALTSGDPHRGTAALIFGKRPEDVTDEERQLGKTSNFAVVYGADAPKIAEKAKEYGISLTLAQAQEIVFRLRAAYRVALEWMAEYTRASIARGYTITPFGRRRRFGFVPPSGPERAAIEREIGNTPIQSTASDVALKGLIRIGQEIDWVRTRLLLTVHDSILAETREDPREIGAWMCKVMCDTPFDVPFEAEAKYGDRWGSLKKLEVA